MTKTLVAVTVVGLTGLLAHPNMALLENKTTFKVKHSTETSVEHYQKEATRSSIGGVINNSNIRENLYKEREASRYSQEMGNHNISNRVGGYYGNIGNNGSQNYNRVSRNYSYDKLIRHKNSTNYNNRVTQDRFSHNYIDSYKERERDNFYKEQNNLKSGYRANIYPKRMYRKLNRPQVSYMRY